jgi:hypothetical protein
MAISDKIFDKSQSYCRAHNKYGLALVLVLSALRLWRWRQRRVSYVAEGISDAVAATDDCGVSVIFSAIFDGAAATKLQQME